jgi:hypothetical protein
MRYAAGAGLCPAGGSLRRGEPLHHRTTRRLLKRLNCVTARKEGAHEGTRGSLVP